MLAVFFALALAASPYMSFEEYCAEFGKKYNAKEHTLRKDIFERRVELIKIHNAQSSSYKKGVNHMTDSTDPEFASLLGFSTSLSLKRRQASRFTLRPRSFNVSTMALPDSVDWSKTATTRVKNQGGCGSCWAFAATEAIESCTFIDTQKLFELSPQEFVDCVEDLDNCGGTGGCEGATPDLAFNYTMTAGQVLEKDYPYRGQDGKCKMDTLTPAVKVGGWVDVDTNSYEGLLAAVAKRPVTIGVAANDWGMYSSGVLSFDGCDAEINHAVLLVGYGTDAEHGDYWKVQNSWGEGWGEGGFIRLARSANDGTNCKVDKNPSVGFGCTGGPAEATVCGTCGILFAPSYPTKCTVA